MDKLAALIETPDLSWRDILYEVLSGLDPWDINLSELASRYSARVREMREMNFRLPANVIIVSSVLLRMKADLLSPRGEEPYAELSESLNFLFDGDFSQVLESLREGGEEEFEFSLKPQRIPRRRVTADELIDAIQKALEERGVRRKRTLEARVEEREVFIEDEADVLALIEDTYRQVAALLSRKEVVLFSELARTRDEVISTLMSLLHLSNEARLFLSQEKLFGEIYIRNTSFAD